MSKVDVWTQKSFLLIKQCPGPSYWCDHTSWFRRLGLQRAGNSPHPKWKFSWGGTQTADYRIKAQESDHWAILTHNYMYQTIVVQFLSMQIHNTRGVSQNPACFTIKLPWARKQWQNTIIKSTFLDLQMHQTMPKSLFALTNCKLENFFQSSRTIYNDSKWSHQDSICFCSGALCVICHKSDIGVCKMIC